MTFSVCMVADSVPPLIGGSQTSVALMVRGFTERGVRVVLVTTNEPDEPLRAAVASTAGVIHVIRPCHGAMTWGARLLGPSNELAAVLGASDLSVVHAFSHSTALSAALALPLADPPIFCASFHEISSDHDEAGRSRSTFVHNMPGLRAIVPLSDYFENISSRFCRDPSLIYPARQGIDLALFGRGDEAHGRDLLGATDGRPIVLYPARWAPAKGQLDLVHAIALLVKEVEPERRPAVRLVGSVSASPHVDSAGYRARILEAIEANDLTDAVEVVEDVSRHDMPDLYAAATVVAAPSHREGLGFIGVEAMASAKPLVATRNDGFTQYCEDGVNSLLVDVESPAQLAKAIRRLLDDGDLAQRLAVSALETAQRFSYANGVDDLLRIYDRLGADVSSVPPL